MVSQNGFDEHLLELLTDQRAKRDAIQASVQKQLDELDKKIEALEITLRLHKESGKRETKESKLLVAPHDLVAHAHTHKQALEYLASKSDGVVNYIDARNVIMAAGLTKGQPRNIASHLYRMMAEGEDWEKVAPGTFRFLKYKPTLFEKESLPT